MADDIWDRLLAGVQTLIQGLTLLSTTGATGDVQAVLIQTLGDKLNVAAFPVVVVSMAEQSEETVLQDFISDHIVYPATIQILDEGRNLFQLAWKDYRIWRHQIGAALRTAHNSRPVLNNCPELYDMRAKWLPVLTDKRAMANPMAWNALAVRLRCNEARVKV